MDKRLHKLLKKLGISTQQWQDAQQSKERICLIQSQKNEFFWLKKAAPARGIWRYKALNLFSRISRLPLVKAVPQQGGSTALQTEARRIRSLTAQGIQVPHIHFQTDDFLLLSHLGHSIVIQFKDKGTTTIQKRDLLSACLEAIKNVHNKGQHLSQAFVRNMVQITQDPISIGFIDFEDDPKTVMTLPEAQARDLLLFVDSVARFFLNDQAFFQQAINDFLKGHDVNMVSLLKNTSSRLQWITKLPCQSWLGHDYEKLKLALLAMKNI